MHLFSQFSFLDGLNARTDPSKLGASSYPLLFNGRVTRNTVKPTKAHRKLDTPAGEKQGTYAIGRLLITFVSGMAYWLDTTNETAGWNLIDGWTALETSGRIYAELVPVSYYQGTITYDGSNVDLGAVRKDIFPDIPAPTVGYLFVTDGVNQPRIITPSGLWRTTKTYAEWAVTDPEYVPLCVLPRRSGQKLYLVDPTTRTKIYHSVSGRFLDFVINRNETGGKNGDAETTFKSVDFNELTCTAAMSDGSLFAGTLYSSYAVVPDYSDTFFGEPLLPETPLFNTGPVNERSFAGVNREGALDLAFITQTGIQSFNVTRQTQSESNNFALGAPIAEILSGTQSATAAINFDVYALFSVNTIYGKAVIVYDNTLEKFVSVDTGFGEVVDFAIVKAQGNQRLFFSNTDGDIYEAYAGELNAVCRLQVGEYCLTAEEGQIAGVMHRPSMVKVQFTKVTALAEVSISVYADGQLVGSGVRTLNTTETPSNPPLPLPFASSLSSAMLGLKTYQVPYAWKSGIFIEWQGDAQLAVVSFFGDTQSIESAQSLTAAAPNTRIINVFADTKFYPTVATTADWTLVTGLTVGSWYSVSGQCHIGSRLVENSIFQAEGIEVNLKGSLRAVGLLRETYNLMLEDEPDLLVGCGDIAYDSGTLQETVHFTNLFKSRPMIMAAGNHDLDTENGKHFWNILKQRRYFSYRLNDQLEFFVLNSGYNTAGAVVEPDGVDQTSNQAKWLKASLENSTALHKVVVCHQPPYTQDDGHSPGLVIARWPYAQWGASMVLSGHAHNYQRFSVNEIPYVVVPSSDSNVRGFAVVASTAVVRFSLPGYLRLRLNRFNLFAEFVESPSGNVKDSFGIYG